eukprot:TRINITY_DN4595_c0_g1_i1.p1 TRINITY_DN4595_c0_g1~~TRINITY_DN4595_c0_g1_i1.p1  ORF type:complete len:193 (-),score=56.13 TRINITY_DN4595_c0_g1_i1:62-640(-)
MCIRDRSKYSKISVTQVVEKNAKISERRTELDELRNQTRDQTGKDENRKIHEQKRIKELGEIEMAVDNLYNRCFLQGKQSKSSMQEAERLSKLSDEEKVMEMLSRLCIFFLDMREISKEVKHHPRPKEYLPVPVPRKTHRQADESTAKLTNAQETGSSYGNQPARRTSLQGSQDRRRSLNAQVMAISNDPLA